MRAWLSVHSTNQHRRYLRTRVSFTDPRPDDLGSAGNGGIRNRSRFPHYFDLQIRLDKANPRNNFGEVHDPCLSQTFSEFFDSKCGKIVLLNPDATCRKTCRLQVINDCVVTIQLRMSDQFLWIRNYLVTIHKTLVDSSRAVHSTQDEGRFLFF
ncbi:hypothetical protein X750_28840 [Mesorhizobium sp. LNJC394B00]|nr:hypothetical protein X750_28840 [Mesorhizobium sp. LNJC394B00]